MFEYAFFPSSSLQLYKAWLCFCGGLIRCCIAIFFAISAVILAFSSSN
jgi:hypothetical protein